MLWGHEMDRSSLTETKVKNLKPKDKAYKMSDAGGLYIEVHPNGSKYWRYKYRYFSKEKRLALGVYPEVTLAQARERHKEARSLLAQGIDPNQAKHEAKIAKQFSTANGFADLGLEYLEKRAIEKAAPVTLSKMRWILEQKLNPILGRLPIAEITPVQLLGALRAIEADGLHETASRAKRVASQVFRYAVATGRAERDISVDLKGALVVAKPKHRAAILTPEALKTFLIACDNFTGTQVVKTALQLTPMLFQRPGELRHMEWAELNLDEGLWEIPAHKMKMREPHIVPLPTQAVALLRQLEPLTSQGVYVFPSGRKGGNPLSENGVLKAIRTMGFGADQVTPHGFRATARTLLDEVLNERVEYIEQQLAHAVKDANGRAYNRTKHLGERKRMMQSWADYLDHLKNS